MESFLILACCLSLSFAVPTTETGQLILQNKSTVTPGQEAKHTTKATLANSSAHGSTIPALTTDTTLLNSTVEDNSTTTVRTSATATNTSHPQTLEPTTTMPLTNSTSLMTNITTQTTVTPSSAPDTTTTALITTAQSSTVNATSHTTQGLRLSISERNLTITFSFMLGVLAVVVVIIMFHKCSHKLQYLHQPLNDTDDRHTFTADNDTLVISGGLYDGHPIYDNVPPAGEDESNFRLEFLH